MQFVALLIAMTTLKSYLFHEFTCPYNPSVIQVNRFGLLALIQGLEEVTPSDYLINVS